MKKTIFGCTLLIIGTMLVVPMTGASGLALPIYAVAFVYVIWGSMDNKASK